MEFRKVLENPRCQRAACRATRRFGGNGRTPKRAADTDRKSLTEKLAGLTPSLDRLGGPRRRQHEAGGCTTNRQSSPHGNLQSSDDVRDGGSRRCASRMKFPRVIPDRDSLAFEAIPTTDGRRLGLVWPPN